MWGVAEEPTIKEKFEYALKSVDPPKPTAVFYINRSRQKNIYKI